jgi:hypothetical protein
MKLTIISAMLFSSFAFTASLNPALIDVQTGKPRIAPEKLDQEAYLAWAEPILKPAAGTDYTSAFTSLVFEWYESERERGLPQEAIDAKEKFYINVQRPLEQTIELEEAGEIEEGNTVGAEVYAELDASAEQALTAMLFRWGKPVGKEEGNTYPAASPFSRRVDYFAPVADWGSNGFASLSLRRDGGIVKDMADRYMVLVYGDKDRGYDVLMQYIKPAGKTSTSRVFAIAMIRPLANGKTSYKISTRYQGQSYKVLGNVSIGRSNIGFNPEKVKAVQIDYANQLKELKETGNIKDKKTDIEFGK